MKRLRDPYMLLSKDTLNLYRLEARKQTPWGDYGDILVHGMTGRADGSLQLYRTAPYVPPISVSMDIVVTEETKELLEGSGLSGLSFRPVVKAHIVNLPWHLWDRTAGEPLLYPESGEPEDYIDERDHDPSAAAALGNLYEVCVAPSARVERIPNPEVSWGRSIRLVPESWDGSDFFGAEGVTIAYVSENAKRWLEANLDDYVSFRPA